MDVVPCTKTYLEKSATVLENAYFSSFEEAQLFLAEKIAEQTCYVCVENEDVMGLFVYWRDYSHYANYLTDIVVAERHRRKGVATALLDAYVELCRKEQPKKQPYALSSTDVTNEASIAMHTTFGFEHLGTIKNLHYGKDELFFGYKLF